MKKVLLYWLLALGLLLMLNSSFELARLYYKSVKLEETCIASKGTPLKDLTFNTLTVVCIHAK